MAGTGKRQFSPAQLAAMRENLAKGRVTRQANIKGRRASRARQSASSQDSKILRLASQPDAAVDVADAQQAADDQAAPEAEPAASGAEAAQQNASGNSSGASKKKSRLSQEEQNKLLFSFDMDDDKPDAAAAAATPASGGAKPKSGGLKDKFTKLLTKDAPASSLGGITDAEERDAQQAAAQWTDLAAVAFLFLGARLFGDDLKPTNEMAQAMAAPLCRIAMRHIAPLRTASADTYDIVAFMTACLVYYNAIEPALKAKRSERLVVNATVAQPAVEQQTQRGNVTLLTPEAARGSRRRDEESPSDSREGVRKDDGGQPANSYFGSDVIEQVTGIQL